MRDYTEADVATAAERLAERVWAGWMSAEDAALVLRAAYPGADMSSTSHDTEAGT